MKPTATKSFARVSFMAEVADKASPDPAFLSFLLGDEEPGSFCRTSGQTEVVSWAPGIEVQCGAKADAAGVPASRASV